MSNSSEDNDELEDTLHRLAGLTFDRCQFDHSFGHRKAGTVMNNVLPAEYHKRYTREECDIDAMRQRVKKLRKKFKIELDNPNDTL